MDKNEFVEESPLYYALAIAAYLNLVGSTVSQQSIRKSYTVVEDDEEICLLDNPNIWNRAIEWLGAQEMIRIRKGAFGPALYSKEEKFSERWERLRAEVSAFHNYSIVEDKQSWLREALKDIIEQADELEVSEADFERGDLEWTPIQLDLSDPAVVNAVAALSGTIEEIRKDNGYAAKFPHERDFVLEGLSGAVEKIKAGSVSPGYLRAAWTQLTTVGRRFAGATLETVIVGAKQAIVELVKSQGGELLRYLLHLFH